MVFQSEEALLINQRGHSELSISIIMVDIHSGALYCGVWLAALGITTSMCSGVLFVEKGTFTLLMVSKFCSKLTEHTVFYLYLLLNYVSIHPCVVLASYVFQASSSLWVRFVQT